MKIEIEKKEQHFVFEAAQGERILYAGLRAGVALPYECATGTCGTCRARLKDGAVDYGWSQAPGKKNLKAERQEFLMCQAQASADCKIGVPAMIKSFRPDDITPCTVNGIASDWQLLTHDVMAFQIALPEPMRFHAGQFVVLDIPGLEGGRAYSMVNYAPQSKQLEFIVKKKPGGGFSDWVFDSQRGMEAVGVTGPLGRATFHPDEDHNLFMIAGGSGIAGLMSILQHASEINYFDFHRADVFFGVRSFDDAFFIDRLSEIVESTPDKVRVHLVFSEQIVLNGSANKLGSLQPGFGMVHEAAIAGMMPETPNTMAYVAGPPVMVDALIRPLLLELKFPANMIRYDKFG